MESIADLIAKLVFLLILFGVEIIAILILVLSAIYPRRLGVVILLGIVAAVLMFVESFIWLLGIGIASSGGRVTGDDPLIHYLEILIGFSILCLLIYFPTAILRFKARSKRQSDAQSAA
jgi:hypothetical protein